MGRKGVMGGRKDGGDGRKGMLEHQEGGGKKGKLQGKK